MSLGPGGPSPKTTQAPALFGAWGSGAVLEAIPPDPRAFNPLERSIMRGAVGHPHVQQGDWHLMLV